MSDHINEGIPSSQGSIGNDSNRFKLINRSDQYEEIKPRRTKVSKALPEMIKF